MPHLCSMNVNQTADEIRDTFAFLDDWETRYEHIIDLGKVLPDLPDEEKIEDYKVRGCASQVWIVPRSGPASNSVYFQAQSDALIVSGLIAMLTELFNGKRADEILAFDAPAFFSEIGLNEALSAQRANGLNAMLERIKALARLTSENA